MIFNEIAEQGQLSQVLQRRLNMLGAAPAPALMPEIAPTLNLENDRAEWGWLKGERRMQRLVSINAVAAQFGAAQLYIPSTTRVLAVVNHIRVFNANVLNITRLQGIAGGIAGWAAIATTSVDFRWGAQGSSCLLETVTNAVQPAGNGIIGRLNATGMTLNQPIVIAPGTALGIYADVANQIVQFEIGWYERPALPGELV